MAQLALRLDANVLGDFYVDSTCIDCERLLNYQFEWVLPGHGRPIRLPAAGVDVWSALTAVSALKAATAVAALQTCLEHALRWLSA